MSATPGIDLASQPRSTAICAIEWDTRGAYVRALWRGRTGDGITPLHDKVLASAIRGDWGGGLPAFTKVAIDAPLGWPVDFVTGLADPSRWPVAIDCDRSRLERRATDRWVHKTTGKLPLSVSTDRIAYAAMRAAGLLSDYSQLTGHAVDRTGETGIICEAYPDPAIRAFDLWPPTAGTRESYKGEAAGVRASVLARLNELAPWLSMSPVQSAACVDSDDCLDALICALVARATEVHQTHAVPLGSEVEAAAEGWIRLPTQHALSALIVG